MCQKIYKCVRKFYHQFDEAELYQIKFTIFINLTFV